MGPGTGAEQGCGVRVMWGTAEHLPTSLPGGQAGKEGKKKKLYCPFWGEIALFCRAFPAHRTSQGLAPQFAPCFWRRFRHL